MSEEDKRWLDNYSHKKHQSLSETVRKAIRYMKNDVVEKEEKKDNILEITAGIWKSRKLDGLDYVKKLRDEW